MMHWRMIIRPNDSENVRSVGSGVGPHIKRKFARNFACRLGAARGGDIDG